MPQPANRIVSLSIVAVIAAFCVLYKLGGLPLVDPDESRYAESAREMIELGSYMVPYLNYEPRLQKPVAHYLLICASYALLGVSEFSARLPSALAALLLASMTFFFARRFRGTDCAALACLVTAACPLFFVPARLPMPDMVLSCCLVASLFCFYRGWQAAAGNSKKYWYAGFYLFQVCGAWIKGPVAILVPAAVALLFLWQQRDLRELKRMRFGTALALVLLLSLPWYVYVYFFAGQDIVALWHNETLAKFSRWGHHRSDPLYYYLIVLLAGLAPWSFLLPWALYQRLRHRGNDSFLRFLEVWFLFVLVFFSALSSKKVQYVIMLASVFGVWFSAVATGALQAAAGRRDKGLTASLCAFLAVAVAGSLGGLPWLSRHQPDLLRWGEVAFVTLGVPALAAVWLAFRGRATSALVALSMATLLSIIPVVECAGPLIDNQRSTKALVHEYEGAIRQARHLYSGVTIFNSLPFYLRRRVIISTDKNFLAQRLQDAEPCIVFISEKRYKRSRELLAPYLAEFSYGKVILSNFALRPPSN